MPIGHHLRSMALSLAVGAMATHMSLGVELTVTDGGKPHPRGGSPQLSLGQVSTLHEFSLVDYPDPAVDIADAPDRVALALESVGDLSDFDAPTSPDGPPPLESVDSSTTIGTSGPGCQGNCGHGEPCDAGCACGCGSTCADCSCAGCGSGWSGCTSGCGSRMGFILDFWLAQGITGNADDPVDNFNLPVTFNDRAGEYQMNQLYLSLGRAVKSSPNAWDFGGRVDLLYGTDYFFTTAIGLETRSNGSPHWNSSDGPRATELTTGLFSSAALYGLAMPQLYGEVYAPVLGGVNFKLGHFYTTVGYEDVRAPKNFFYSHSYTKQYGEPFTHTGVLSTFDFGPNVDAHFGVTRGWDTWEDPNDKPGYLAGITLCAKRRTSLAFALHTGREDVEGINDRTVYSLVFTRRINPALTYVLQHDFGMESNREIDDVGQRDDAKWYSLVNYLYWDMSEALALGMRVEWFRDQDNARVLEIPVERLTSGGNYAEVTLGANWKPTPRLLVRPEVRWDTSDALARIGDFPIRPFVDGTQDHQFLFGTDVIFRF